jgi:hypothetical protein
MSEKSMTCRAFVKKAAATLIGAVGVICLFGKGGAGVASDDVQTNVRRIETSSNDIRCSFCGIGKDRGVIMIAVGADDCICERCVDYCNEILDELRCSI